MVEKRGIEPLSTECKSVVFPLNYIPINGRMNRTWTYDFNLVRVALYQLSYHPKISGAPWQNWTVIWWLQVNCNSHYTNRANILMWRLRTDLNREQMITNHSFYLFKLQSQSGGWRETRTPNAFHSTTVFKTARLPLSQPPIQCIYIIHFLETLSSLFYDNSFRV